MRAMLCVAFILSVVAVASDARAARCSKDWISFTNAFQAKGPQFIYIRRADILTMTWNKPPGTATGEIVVRSPEKSAPLKYYYANRGEFGRIAACLHDPEYTGKSTG